MRCEKQGGARELLEVEEEAEVGRNMQGKCLIFLLNFFSFLHFYFFLCKCLSMFHHHHPDLIRRRPKSASHS